VLEFDHWLTIIWGMISRLTRLYNAMRRAGDKPAVAVHHARVISAAIGSVDQAFSPYEKMLIEHARAKALRAERRALILRNVNVSN
jgi:hypothetical protein